MNCLKYLLQLRIKKHKFDIYYNDNHCIGVNSLDIFDYQGMFKEEILNGSKLTVGYLPIEQYYNKEQLREMFNLTEEEFKVL